MAEIDVAGQQRNPGDGRRIVSSYCGMALMVLLLMLECGSLASGEPTAVKPTGTVCVASVAPSNSRPMTLGNPDGGGRDFTFAVRLDQRPPVDVSQDRSVSIGDIPLAGRHRLTLLRRSKTVESFTFTFASRGGPHLCLWFKSLYETWSLDAWSRRAHGCRCESSK